MMMHRSPVAVLLLAATATLSLPAPASAGGEGKALTWAAGFVAEYLLGKGIDHAIDAATGTVDVARMDLRIRALEGKFPGHADDLESLRGRIGGYSRLGLGTFETFVDPVVGRIDRHERMLADHARELGEHRNQIAGLRQELEETKRRVEALEPPRPPGSDLPAPWRPPSSPFGFGATGPISPGKPWMPPGPVAGPGAAGLAPSTFGMLNPEQMKRFQAPDRQGLSSSPYRWPSDLGQTQPPATGTGLSPELRRALDRAILNDPSVPRIPPFGTPAPTSGLGLPSSAGSNFGLAPDSSRFGGWPGALGNPPKATARVTPLSPAEFDAARKLGTPGPPLGRTLDLDQLFPAPASVPAPR